MGQVAGGSAFDDLAVRIYSCVREFFECVAGGVEGGVDQSFG